MSLPAWHLLATVLSCQQLAETAAEAILLSTGCVCFQSTRSFGGFARTPGPSPHLGGSKNRHSQIYCARFGPNGIRPASLEPTIYFFRQRRHQKVRAVTEACKAPLLRQCTSGCCTRESKCRVLYAFFERQ